MALAISLERERIARTQFAHRERHEVIPLYPCRPEYLKGPRLSAPCGQSVFEVRCNLSTRCILGDIRLWVGDTSTSCCPV